MYPLDHIVFSEYLASLDDEDRLLIETSIRMHDVLCHRDDEEADHDETEYDDEEYTVRPLHQRKWMKPANLKDNKFVNEVVVNQDEVMKWKGGHLDALKAMLIDNGVTEVVHDQFIGFLLENGYESEAVIEDSKNNDQSNLLPVINGNVSAMNMIQTHLVGEDKDSDKLPVFSFGNTIWYYWSFAKDAGNFNVARYSNLKQECLQNDIHSISIKMFQQVLAKALLFQQSERARSIEAMNRDADNGRYNIPPNLPLSVSHVFCLLLYCNHTELQFNYKKHGCRERAGQSWDKFKAKNAEIGHWYRLLNEVVIFYGTDCAPTDVFYTGLSIKLSFTTFAPDWCSPFSTTVDETVAFTFCDDSGIILKLKPSIGSKDSYFDVEWFVFTQYVTFYLVSNNLFFLYFVGCQTLLMNGRDCSPKLGICKLWIFDMLTVGGGSEMQRF